jgi:hypothetical protein
MIRQAPRRWSYGNHGITMGRTRRVPVGSDIDAIVVPTIRPPSQLSVAADLAVALDCPLVTLHSRGDTTAAAAVKEIRAEVDLFAIDVATDYQLPKPILTTSTWIAGWFPRQSDLSIKRNLALILGCLAGWSKIFFLDDDMTEVEPEDVRRASRLLDEYDAVGLENKGFPDNSVVCHANRETGGDQSSFVGGGALVVEITRFGSFFPSIYNDDWFYLLNDDEKLHPAIIGRVVQAEYDPFLNPERARSEEFGDVLAEGLFWLLEEGQSISEADQQYWDTFLARRERFILDVFEKVTKDAGLEYDKKKRWIASLNASLDRLSQIAPELCVEYMKKWRQDRVEWQRHTGSVYAPGARLEDALRKLMDDYGPGLEWAERDSSTWRPSLATG